MAARDILHDADAYRRAYPGYGRGQVQAPHIVTTVCCDRDFPEDSDQICFHGWEAFCVGECPAGSEKG